MWPGEISESWNCSLNKEGLSHLLIGLSESGGKCKPSFSNESEIDRLNLEPWAEGKFSVIARCRDEKLIHGSLMSCNQAPYVLPGVVTSRDTPLQLLARNLLAAPTEECCRSDEEVVRQEFDRLNVTILQIQQDRRNSILVGVERNDRDLTSSFWSPSDAHADSADESYLEMSISRLPARSQLLDHPPTLAISHGLINPVQPFNATIILY